MVILIVDSGIGLTVTKALLEQKNAVEQVIIANDFVTKYNNQLEIFAKEFIENHVFELNAIKCDVDEYLSINLRIEHHTEYKEKLINSAKPIVDAENPNCPIRGTP